jgi:hypothetical protein
MKNRSASGPQVFEGVDRIRGAVTVDVDPAHGESGIGSGGDHRHQIAVLALGDIGLLIRLTGRYEHDLIEVEILSDFTGSDQVPVMDGVEGTAHHADPAAPDDGLDHGAACLVVVRPVAGLARGLVAVSVRDIPEAPHDEGEGREHRCGHQSEDEGWEGQRVTLDRHLGDGPEQ